MRHVQCPGCNRTLLVTNDDRPRCSPCNDVTRTVDDGEHIRHYNAKNQLVNRTRSKQQGPQTTVIRQPIAPDPGAEMVPFGSMALGYFANGIVRG